MDNQQRPFGGLRELALFAGAGGGILGGHLLGWRTICAVEWAAYPAAVLAARQDDGFLPPFPIWSDVQTFDGKPWRGRVDVVSGGFPCQDISAAGKGAGIDGERSGMWSHMARIIGEVQPVFVYVENSTMLTSRGLGRVLGDLAALGYDAEWMCLSAAECGANHQRDRIWILAHSNGLRQLQPQGRKQDERGRSGDGGQDVANSSCVNEQGEQSSSTYQEKRTGQEQRSLGSCGYGFGQWPVEPDVGRVVDGMAARTDRLKAIGNGQVPRVAATAFLELYRRITT